jgi:hypothetical protein
MPKEYLIVCGLFCAVLISATGAEAADIFTACVGDCSKPPSVLAGPGPSQTDYRYDCEFAKANPSLLGEATAKRVCYIEKATKNYTVHDFIAYSTSPAAATAACGSVLFYVLCK